jgi:hypothetical protein
MARFQALTSPVLDSELDRLREEMGLRDNQKAELLREITALASWVVAQARAGRIVEARGPDGVEVLRHPAVDTRGVLGRIVLSPDEADRLESLLDSDASPSAEVQSTLRRLSDPDRRSPKIRWPDR